MGRKGSFTLPHTSKAWPKVWKLQYVYLLIGKYCDYLKQKALPLTELRIIPRSGLSAKIKHENDLQTGNNDIIKQTN